jgi:hypothetical protein
MTAQLFRCFQQLTLVVMVGLTTATSVSAQEIKWNFRAERGQRFVIDYTKEGEQFRDDALVVRAKSTCEIAVEILAKDAKGYTVRWTYQRVAIESPQLAANPIADQMARMVNGMVVEFRADTAGLPTELLNKQAVRDHMASGVDGLIALLAAGGRSRGATQDQIDFALRPFVAMKTMMQNLSDPQLDAMTLEEPRQLQFAAGGTYVVDKAIVYADKLANPMGGTPIEAQGQFILRRSNLSARQAIVEWEQDFDPKSTAESVLRSIPTLSQLLGEFMAGAALQMPPPAMTVTQRGRFTLDRNSGHTLSSEVTRTIAAESLKRVERRTLVLRPAR